MKQIISRMIQICLIVVAVWWVINPMVRFMNENQEPEKEIIDLKLSQQEREVLQADILVCYQEYVSNTKLALKQGGVFGGRGYFKTLNYKDSLFVSNEVKYLLDYNHFAIFQIDGIERGLVNSFYDEMRIENITRDELEEARILVFGKPTKSAPITLRDFYTLIIKLLNFYLFLGLLIFLGSINRVLRNSDNDALFDPRDKLKFLFHLFIWPVRLGLWIRGNIVVRQYGTKLRVLNEKEKELISNFVNGVKGYTDLHSYYERRGLVTRRSFLMATLFFVLAVIPFGFASTTPLASHLVKITVVESKEDPPPDIVQYELEHNYVKVYLYEKSLLISNIFQVFFDDLVMHNFAYLVFPKKIYQEVPWKPPKNVRIFLI